MRVLAIICLTIMLGVAGFAPVAGQAKAGTTANGNIGNGEQADSVPLVAVYLTVKERHGTFVLGSSRQVGSLRRDQLARAARDTGLEVVLPEVSGILFEAIMAARIAAGDLSGLRRGAAELGTQNLLSGRIVYLGPERWAVNWSFSNARGRRHWRKADVTFGDAIKSGLSMATDALAGRAELEPHPAPKPFAPAADDVEGRQDSRDQTPN